MQALYQGKRPVGEMADDGAVYAVAGRGRQQIGAVADDGTVITQGQAIGLVDTAGNVFDGSGSALGSVDMRGLVFRYGKPFGSVKGDDPRRGGAALLLLFDEPTQPVYRPPVQPSEPVHWAIPLIGLGLALMALLFVVAFVVATAVVWAVMLLLASLCALWLAGDVARTLPEDRLAALQTATWATKRGQVQHLAPSSLSPFLSPLPLLFLALTPALAYGLIIGCVSLGASSPDNATGNLVLFGLAIAAGTVVSYLAARKILRTRLNTLLLARLSLPTSPPVGTARDWNRFAGYAGMGLAALLVLGGGTASWQSSRHASPSATSGNAPSAAAVTSPMPSTSTASAPTLPRPTARTEGNEPPPSTTAFIPGERFPQTRTSSLHDSDINGWSYSGVRYALNEMYARHGYSFKSAPILHQFQKFSWYQPVAGRSQADIEAQFTPTERANQLLLAHRRDALQRAGQAIK